MIDEKFYLRLDKLEKYLDWNKEKMAEALGIKLNSYYTSRASGRGFKLDNIIHLTNKIDGINLNWLLTGDGSMFLLNKYNISSQTDQSISEPSTEYNSIMVEILETVKRIEEKIK